MLNLRRSSSLFSKRQLCSLQFRSFSAQPVGREKGRWQQDTESTKNKPKAYLRAQTEDLERGSYTLRRKWEQRPKTWEQQRPPATELRYDDFISKTSANQNVPRREATVESSYGLRISPANIGTKNVGQTLSAFDTQSIAETLNEPGRIPNLIYVFADSTIEEAIETMTANEVNTVIVLGAQLRDTVPEELRTVSHHNVLGCLSQSTIIQEIVALGRDPARTEVWEVSLAEDVYIGCNATVLDALAQMTTERTLEGEADSIGSSSLPRALLVVNDQGKVHGVVTIGSLVRIVILEFHRLTNFLETYMTGTKYCMN